MSNASSDANSGDKLEHDLACLTEMFPCVDYKVLRNYLEIFSDQANHLSVIIDMLLQEESMVGSNLDQIATQEQSAIKQKTGREDCNSCSIEADSVELLPKLQRRDSSGSETDSLPPVLGEDKFDAEAKVSSSNKSELLTSCSENSDKKGVNSVTSPKCNSDDNDCDIVFVKSVASSARKSFQRTSNCISKSGTTSPSQRNGICIRYKGGILHPSMTKPRKLQIVEIDADEKSCTGNNNTQSLANRDQSKGGQSPGRKRQSIAKPSYSKTSTVVHCAEPSDSCKEVVLVEISSRKEGLSGTASVSDLEILKKVFPDADPAQIGLLLEKYASEPNKVALVGKELGNKPDTQAQSLKRKVLLPRVTWFWESDNKLVPFTESECNVLEKEFQNCKSDDSGGASDKGMAIMLPGSTKSVKVNFLNMTMACSNNGTKSHIFRVPEGNEDNKEISGKCLIPQEALTVPNDWQQQNKGAELVRVRPGSAEWDHVQGSLKRSIKKAIVVDIQRVQNKWLYRKYAMQRHLMKEKNGAASINEKELFHGTRQTSPEAIWRGEDGFDMRYSADGMWGRGAYFASEASYSHHGFVYHDAQTQHFQLFLAHVLTGDSISLPPDSNLKMPPLKKGSNIRYDSINGVANNCTVYILYKLDMAYPAYLITYTVTNNRR